MCVLWGVFWLTMAIENSETVPAIIVFYLFISALRGISGHQVVALSVSERAILSGIYIYVYI
jgi:hypothetical protein